MSSASTRYSTMSAGTIASMPSARVTRFLLSENFRSLVNVSAVVQLLTPAGVAVEPGGNGRQFLNGKSGVGMSSAVYNIKHWHRNFPTFSF